MEHASPVVRIVVVQPESFAEPAGGEVADALRPIGPGAVMDIVHDAGSCLAACRNGTADLVVVDQQLTGPCRQILAGLRNGGPPVVVVSREADADAALEAFRQGAADCVALDRGGPEALPVVALEQIRRHRAARERGLAERRMRDLERYTDNIIQNMNSALLVTGLDGRVTFGNPPAGRILGEELMDIRGRDVSDWFGREPDGSSLLTPTLAEGRSFRGAERTLTRRDGSAVPIGVSAAPFFDSEGRQIGAVAIFQDLTEVKQLQSQVLQTEKMASIGQLAAGVAHEINNPMGFIHANLFQMAEYLADLRGVWQAVARLQEVVESGDLAAVRDASRQLAALAEKVDADYLLADLGKAIRESQEGSERIRHIVNDLRDFSHQGNGERVMADLSQSLDSTASIVWPMMKQIVVLEREYRQIESVLCDPMQIKQVFMNLLVNAYQAIEERVGESGETGKIWLRTQQCEDGVIVEVADTGVGIPEENIDRIFDPFFTTKKVGAGTGLGLSTSFNIVKRHGGQLTVESKPDAGTTFRLFLPTDGVGALDDVD